MSTSTTRRNHLANLALLSYALAIGTDSSIKSNKDYIVLLYGILVGLEFPTQA